MFIHTRNINGTKQDYLEHSYRLGKRIEKVSLYLPKASSIRDIITLNKTIIDLVTEKRCAFLQHKKHSRFFDYGNQLYHIERSKVLYSIFFAQTSPEEQERIKDEFLRSFLVNSMAMEGGTVSYDIAKAIDEKKRFRMDGINALDIPLYQQLRSAYQDLEKMRLRYPSQLKDLHKKIYQGIYPFAGNFRNKKITFGNIGKLAITVNPEEVHPAYKKTIQTYQETKKTLYDFERIVTFHQDLQKVHGFEDGNSRLGRLIMTVQFMQQGYPPPLVKSTQSRAYRMALVSAINEKKNTPLLKFFYTSYMQTFNKFWLPVLEESFKKAKM